MIKLVRISSKLWLQCCHFVGSIYLFEKATKMMLQEICLRLIIYPQKFCIWSLSKKDTSCIKVFLLWNNNHNGTWAGKGIMGIFCSPEQGFWTVYSNTPTVLRSWIMDIILYCKNILFWNPCSGKQNNTWSQPLKHRITEFYWWIHKKVWLLLQRRNNKCKA